MGVIKGDTRSLDSGSYMVGGGGGILNLEVRGAEG